MMETCHVMTGCQALVHLPLDGCSENLAWHPRNAFIKLRRQEEGNVGNYT